MNTPSLPSRRSITARLSKPLRSAWNFILVGTIGLLFAFPILWAASASFKTTSEIDSRTFPLSWVSFFPSQVTFENYIYVFQDLKFYGNIVNSVIVAAGQVSLSVLAASLAGYAFARLQFRGANLVFGILLMTAFIPFEAIVVPLYKLMGQLGLVSTYPAIFLPFAANPFGIYLMRQAFREVPREIEEAASIDGAGPLRVFFSIALPNVLPSIATLILIQFIWAWNSYVWPLVVMQDPNKQIIQVAIAAIKSTPTVPMSGPIFAASTAVTVPLVVLSILLQRYYVRGLVSSGMK